MSSRRVSSGNQEASPLLGKRVSSVSISSGETSSLLDSDTSTDDGSLPISYGIYDTATAIDSDVEANRDSARSGRSPGIENSATAHAPKNAAQTTIVRVIIVLMIGIFTSNADGSLVLATHPVIASEFNVLSDSTWLFISFSLAGASTQTLVRNPFRISMT